MEIKSDYFLKAGFAFILVFIVGKFLGDFLKGLWGDLGHRFFYGKKEENPDLEILIGRKIKEMRLNGLTTNSPSSSISPTNIHPESQNISRTQSTQSFYQEAYKKAKSTGAEEKKIREYKAVLEMLEQLQWGDNKHYKVIESLLAQNYAFESIPNETTQSFGLLLKEILAKNILTSLHPEYPLEYSSLTSLLAHKLAFDYLIKKMTSGQDIPLSTFKMSSLSTSEKINPLAFPLAILLNNKKITTSENINFKEEKEYFKNPNIIQNQLKLNDNKFPLNHFVHFALSHDKKRMKSTMEIQDHFVKLSKFLNNFLPLPQLEKNDDSTAHFILQVSPDDPFDQIKKSYKTLVSFRHPDKFQSLNLPHEISKIINENFFKIQESYKILKEIRGEN